MLLYVNKQKEATSSLLQPPILRLTLLSKLTDQQQESANLTVNQGSPQRVNHHLTTCRQTLWRGATEAQGLQ